MHEMSLCESILQILEQYAAEQNFSEIKTVYLEIGQLSSVEPDALRFAFDIVTKSSIAEHAQLEIIEVAGRAWCFQCQKQVSIAQRYDACPECEGYTLQIVEGEQMRVKELEVS